MHVRHLKMCSFRLSHAYCFQTGMGIVLCLCGISMYGFGKDVQAESTQ